MILPTFKQDVTVIGRIVRVRHDGHPGYGGRDFTEGVSVILVNVPILAYRLMKLRFAALHHDHHDPFSVRVWNEGADRGRAFPDIINRSERGILAIEQPRRCFFRSFRLPGSGSSHRVDIEFGLYPCSA